MVYSVAIAGASGYVGGELLRIIAQHPELQVKTVTANSNVGQSVAALHPHLAQFGSMVFQDTNAQNLAGHDIVLLAMPHTKSAEVAGWLSADTLVLDCGADFRLESEADWDKFYGSTFAGTWTYGMPELIIDGGAARQRQNLSGVKRIAVPGCNATAITLALAPGLAAGVIDSQDIVSVLSVGTSGAGRTLKPELLASEIMNSASAYGVGGIHRHTPEIEQNLRKSADADVQINFTPVLVPMTRGILAVNTAKIIDGVSAAEVRAAYELAYANEPFVHVLPEGQYPATSSTLGVNTCLIGIAIDEHAGRVVIVSALDNMVKGTAGAAIQSLNLALGLPEQTGLTVNGVAP
jgi:N-acetyl-gamma-glutamyl-phosphate reductase